MMQNRVLKKKDLNSYDFPESVLIDSEFIFGRDSKGGFVVELIYNEPGANPPNRVGLANFYLSLD